MNQALGRKTVFVRNLEQLVGWMFSPNQSCLQHAAKHFFNNVTAQQQQLRETELHWQQAQQAKAKPEVLQKTRKAFTDLQYTDEKQRLQRWSLLTQVAEELLKLSEGINTTETLTLSARLLGGLLITALPNKRKTSLMLYAYKPLYHAALAIRLLDHLLEQQLVKDASWQQLYSQRNLAQPEQCPYRQQLQIPLVMACIIQHLSQLSTHAQQLLNEDDEQSTKIFSPEERASYLQHCQQAMLDFLHYGLGELPSKGANREQREQNQQQQQQLQQQLQQLLTASADSIPGGILKVCHAYTSVIIPGRERYDYHALPKAILLMRESAKNGAYHSVLVDRLFRIVGLFPQGYGVVFTPLGDDGKPQLKYEFAIVNSLLPEKPEHPSCRVVSRNQQYRNTGYNINLSTELNLYFKPARERLEMLPEKRLRELLHLLYQDGEAQYLLKLLPRCWQPDQFFSVPENQNLWHTAEQRQN